MPLGSHTHPKAAVSTSCQTLISQEAHLSSATTIGMIKQSDAMALSIIVGIPDLAQIYMEPVETNNSSLHASLGPHTHCKAAASTSCQTLTISLEAISTQPLLGMKQSDAMALSIIVGIPDLAHIYIEPMETDSSNLHASGGLTYSPQGCCI